MRQTAAVHHRRETGLQHRILPVHRSVLPAGQRHELQLAQEAALTGCLPRPVPLKINRCTLLLRKSHSQYLGSDCEVDADVERVREVEESRWSAVMLHECKPSQRVAAIGKMLHIAVRVALELAQQPILPVWHALRWLSEPLANRSLKTRCEFPSAIALTPK